MNVQLSLPTLVLLLLTVSRVCVWARPGPLGDGDDPSRPCLHYEGDGCSIPFGLPFFYKKQFTLSCDRHDICYHCGAAYDIPRPTCDQAFRRNTLATCKKEYLNPRISTWGMMDVPSRSETRDPERSEVTPHQDRFLKVVAEHGWRILEKIFVMEVQALKVEHPMPGLKQFVSWFSSHSVHLRMLAHWSRDLSLYLERLEQTSSERDTSPPDLSRVMSLYMLKLQQADTNSTKWDWCAEVKDYLATHNETIPSVARLACPDIEYLTCNLFSEIYFLAVRIFANSSYDKPPEFYCHESWVKKCLPPGPSKSLKFFPQEWTIDTLP